MAGDGNGDGGGVAARPGPRGSVERKRGSRRSLWASRGSEGGPVAVVAVDGSDERARAREGKSREGSRDRERVRESQGLRGAPWRGLGRRAASSAKQEVAGALGRAPRLASAYWQRKTTSGEVDGLGWAAGGPGPGKWAPGKSFCSFLNFLFCFIFI